MDNFLIYLLKVSAGTTLLYLCYLLVFSKDTFYRRNRIILILILLLPTILPALKIHVISDSVVPLEPLNPIENIIFSGNSFETTAAVTVNSGSFDYNLLLIWVYFTITGLFLLRGVISLISTYSIIRKGSVKNSQFPKVIISDRQLPPFSFFPYAVIPADQYKNGNYEDILEHEFAHIRQGHTFDLLLGELFIALQWFNPFVWLIKRSILLNHEYLADHVSITSNRSAKEYQYRLLSFQSGLKSVTLVHSFNSLIKNRIIMINKKPTRKYATLKNILILPVVAFVIYAFATPEYNYVTPVSEPLVIKQVPAIIQKEVKGIVTDVNGKPLEEVHITSTGTEGNVQGTSTDKEGRFSLTNIKEDASLLFYYKGYIGMTLKPDFIKEMSVKMEPNPDYKAPVVETNNAPQGQRPAPIVVIDGIVSEKSVGEARKDLGYDMGIMKMIMGKEATDKYGDKGVNGVYEIITRKKALEMGLKPPFPRLTPDDYPTFNNLKASVFTEWVIRQVKYPSEAMADKLEGWVTIKFTVELNGSISNIVSVLQSEKVLSDEVIRVIQSSPKWDSPKNINVDEPYNTIVTINFRYPGEVLSDVPFVVVEEMPTYPGGAVELLNFIKNNTRYPEEAKSEKIQGRVIIRFIVTKEGKAEGISVLKGVHPLLDAESIRVISMLTGFKPGMQGGKPVNVWYMVPVTFSLDESEPLFSNSSRDEILKFLASNTAYPQVAKMASDTGNVFVVVKMEKGGIIKECKAVTDKSQISVHVLPQIIIVGYKTSAGPDDLRPGKATGDGQTALQTEAVRIANKLGEIDIPEWKEKNMDFALTFRFILK